MNRAERSEEAILTFTLASLVFESGFLLREFLRWDFSFFKAIF